MSIALVLSSIDPELVKEIKKKCVVKPKKTQYQDDPEPVPCFTVNQKEDIIYLPLGVWRTFLDDFPNTQFTRTKVKCTKTPYTIETDPKHFRDQDVVIKEAQKILLENNCVFIACSPGYGKTSLSNFLIAWSKLKAVVLCHLDAINDQWIEEFKNFSNAKVQRVKGKAPIDPSADVYIIGVQKASKLNREDLKDIGIVIFDEAHIATITAFTKSILKFQPKYVVGLSATPERADGMHKLLNMYFGPTKSFITRQEIKDFIVYKVETPFVPEIKYTMVKGRVVPDWSIIINSIAYNEERHDLIVKICLKHPDRRILILSDRQEQSTSLYNKLCLKKESVQLIIGAGKVKKITDESKKARIIVGGAKKVGTGFDDPTLNMLILASDCKNVAQWEGRLRTVGCIVYDLVDNYRTFETHWNKGRQPYFLKRGAEVKVISMRKDSKPQKDDAPSKRFLPRNPN